MADVIVVGGGLSGLCAGKWLTEVGVEVLVLESRGRVGGRTYTEKTKETGYVDMGGSYVGPTQDHLLRIAKELGVETYKVNEVENIIYYEYGSRTYHKPTELPIFWNPFATMDVNNVFRLIDDMGKEIPADAPWAAPHALEWDTTTAKEFADKNTWTRTGRNMMNTLVTAFVANDMYESSLLWFLWYIKQCGGTKRAFSVTNGGQERKFIGGSQQLSQKIAERLGENRVLMNKPVVAINKIQDGYIVQALDGVKYKTKYVILAIPPALQMKIHYDPPLPPIRNQLNQRMPMGSVIKVIVYYKEPFWRKRNCCGTMIIADNDNKDDDHPACYVMDDTKPDGSHAALIGFITADKARRLVMRTKEERKKLLCKSYAEVLNDEQALNPVHYEEYLWMSEQYSGGCYTGTCPPGFLTIYGRKLREPIGGMFFAGTETANHWSGYMEGAVQAGERAAREVLCEMGRLKITDIWRVEPPSQDVIAQPFETSYIFENLPSVPGFIKGVFVCSVLITVTTIFLKKDVTKSCLQTLLKRFID